MHHHQIDADILIIGGGSAGCMAAIRALEENPSLRVVIFEKSDLKYGGSIARGMDALNIVAIPNFTTPELYVEAATIACEGVCDAEPSWVMADRSFALLKKLQSWGVHFPQDKNGKFRTLKYHVKGEFQTAMEEPNLKVMIAERAEKAGAKAVNRTMALSLLKDNGRIAGAVGINMRTGEFITCRAGAVLLTAGGLARFTLPNSGYLYSVFDYPGNTGDGYRMAFEAGAGLTGLEGCHRVMLIKDANMPLLAITVTRGGKVLDVFNNLLMENEVDNVWKMNQAFVEGRGPLRIQLKHLPEEVIAEIEGILFSTERPVQERFFAGRGVNFREQDIELWPTEYQLCGGHGNAGVRVNEKAETGVPGLYCAGDVACVPKQHLSGAFVFGEVAAENAVRYLAENPKAPDVDGSVMQRLIKDRQARAEGGSREISVRELEYKVRRLIGDYVVSPKNAVKLNRWFEWAPKLRQDVIETAIINDAHDLCKSYEIDNIIRCACISAMASLERKESRWKDSHYRVDYPEKNDQEWLCHLVVKQGRNPEEMICAKVPVAGRGKEIAL